MKRFTQKSENSHSSVRISDMIRKTLPCDRDRKGKKPDDYTCCVCVIICGVDYSLCQFLLSLCEAMYY